MLKKMPSSVCASYVADEIQYLTDFRNSDDKWVLCINQQLSSEIEM